LYSFLRKGTSISSEGGGGAKEERQGDRPGLLLERKSGIAK